MELKIQTIVDIEIIVPAKLKKSEKLSTISLAPRTSFSRKILLKTIKMTKEF